MPRLRPSITSPETVSDVVSTLICVIERQAALVGWGLDEVLGQLVAELELRAAFADRCDKETTRSKFPRDAIVARIEHQKYRCALCRVSLSSVHWQADHDLPVKYGGGNSEDNLAILCDECNNGKGASLAPSEGNLLPPAPTLSPRLRFAALARFGGSCANCHSRKRPLTVTRGRIGLDRRSYVLDDLHPLCSECL